MSGVWFPILEQSRILDLISWKNLCEDEERLVIVFLWHIFSLFEFWNGSKGMDKDEKINLSLSVFKFIKFFSFGSLIWFITFHYSFWFITFGTKKKKNLNFFFDFEKWWKKNNSRIYCLFRSTKFGFWKWWVILDFWKFCCWVSFLWFVCFIFWFGHFWLLFRKMEIGIKGFDFQ